METIRNFGRRVMVRLLRLLCLTFIFSGAGIIAWGIIDQVNAPNSSYMAMALVAVGVTLIMATLLWTGNKMGDSFESFAFDVGVLSLVGATIVFLRVPDARPYAILVAVGGAVSLLFCLMVAVKLPPNTELKDPLKEPKPESEPEPKPLLEPPSEPESEPLSEALTRSLSESGEGLNPQFEGDSFSLPTEGDPPWRSQQTIVTPDADADAEDEDEGEPISLDDIIDPQSETDVSAQPKFRGPRQTKTRLPQMVPPAGIPPGGAT